MSFWKKLFGGGVAEASASAKTMDYKGYVITAEPFKEGGQWQLSGRISKDGKEHRFIRADKFTDRNDCADIAISKGQLIVDQLGERMFQ